MSRYNDRDDYGGEPERILAYGRWQRNARTALKGKRGRKALADLREALIALPEHRLIDSALCTVGGVDARLPAYSPEEGAEWAARVWGTEYGDEVVRQSAEGYVADREEERRVLAELITRQGCGVCANGAYIWHQKVKAGMDPEEAFASMPAVFDGDLDGSDSLGETAELGQQAGLTYTLAWELAYRNDETYSDMTPEERWTAFVAWIDAELADAGA